LTKDETLEAIIAGAKANGSWDKKYPDDDRKAQPAQEPMQGTPFGGMNRDDWKDVVSAISKVRDSRGIYLACRPADVFQDWFLLFGTGKLTPPKPQTACCAECGKKESDGWFLYCVGCMDKVTT